MEEQNTRTVYYFKCDGGENPSHHHPRNIQIEENKDGFDVFEHSLGSRFKTYENALDHLKGLYTNIILKSKVVSITEEINKVIYDVPDICKCDEPLLIAKKCVICRKKASLEVQQ